MSDVFSSGCSLSELQSCAISKRVAFVSSSSLIVPSASLKMKKIFCRPTMSFQNPGASFSRTSDR